MQTAASKLPLGLVLCIDDLDAKEVPHRSQCHVDVLGPHWISQCHPMLPLEQENSEHQPRMTT
jgi:hypothetical protein